MGTDRLRHTAKRGEAVLFCFVLFLEALTDKSPILQNRGQDERETDR